MALNFGGLSPYSLPHLSSLPFPSRALGCVVVSQFLSLQSHSGVNVTKIVLSLTHIPLQQQLDSLWDLKLSLSVVHKPACTKEQSPCFLYIFFVGAWFLLFLYFLFCYCCCCCCFANFQVPEKSSPNPKITILYVESGTMLWANLYSWELAVTVYITG